MSTPTVQPPTSANGPDFQGLRVLTVDDSRAIRLFMEDILSGRGAAVVPAASGEEALRRWSDDGPFDLVLLDLNLPDLDGIEVLEQIRGGNEETPVVMITGAGGLVSATEAMVKGADGYIEKQYLSSEDHVPLLHALWQAMEHRAGQVAQKQLEALRTEFYSMVTHDLRNPAGSVWGVIRILLSGKPGPLNPKQEQMLKLAQGAAGKLVGLINDFLDYSTIEAGYLTLELRDADLREVLGGTAQAAEVAAAEKRQRFELELPDQPVRARVDPRRLEQVFDNLISNAVKYTPAGGHVRVQLAVDGEEAVIRVVDSGVGIPPQEQGRLFTPYRRVPGETTRNIRGTGLGLVIVKQITEAHHGRVTAESEGVPGRGSTFEVRLPLSGPAETAPDDGRDGS